MDFEATPLNVVRLLLIALAMYVLYALSRRDRDTNLPLLFYVSLLVFMNFADKPLDPRLFGAGVVLALLLRFEFLNATLTRSIVALETLAVAVIAWQFFSDAFGLKLSLRLPF